MFGAAKPNPFPHLADVTADLAARDAFMAAMEAAGADGHSDASSRRPSRIIRNCCGSTSAAIHRQESRSTPHRMDRSGRGGYAMSRHTATPWLRLLRKSRRAHSAQGLVRTAAPMIPLRCQDISGDDGFDEGRSSLWVRHGSRRMHAYNFSLYARHADERDTAALRRGRPGPALLEYRPRSAAEQDMGCLALPTEGTRGPRAPATMLTGLTGRGPQVPTIWHAYDPEKLLVDPYARDVFFPPSFDREAARRPGSNAGSSPAGGPSEPRAPVRLG